MLGLHVDILLADINDICLICKFVCLSISSWEPWATYPSRSLNAPGVSRTSAKDTDFNWLQHFYHLLTPYDAVACPVWHPLIYQAISSCLTRRSQGQQWFCNEWRFYLSKVYPPGLQWATRVCLARILRYRCCTESDGRKAKQTRRWLGHLYHPRPLRLQHQCSCYSLEIVSYLNKTYPEKLVFPNN